VGPSGQAGKRKRKKGSAWFWAQFSWAGSVGPTRLGSARGSARPAAHQAGSGSGLAGRAGWLGVDPSQAGYSPPPPPRGLGSPHRLLFLAARRLLFISFTLTGRSRVSASTGSSAAGFGSCAAGGCTRVRVGDVSACGGERPEGVRGKASTTWPRRERDVAAASRGWTRTARPWRRQGWGAARRKAGTAVWSVRGVRARGMVKATTAAGCEGGASGSCTRQG
jgi:hypothetical protein